MPLINPPGRIILEAVLTLSTSACCSSLSLPFPWVCFGNQTQSPWGGQSKQLCSEYRNKYINQPTDKLARSISKHRTCHGARPFQCAEPVRGSFGAVRFWCCCQADLQQLFVQSGVESSRKQGMVRILLSLDANLAEEISILLLEEKKIEYKKPLNQPSRGNLNTPLKKKKKKINYNIRNE